MVNTHSVWPTILLAQPAELKNASFDNEFLLCSWAPRHTDTHAQTKIKYLFHSGQLACGQLSWEDAYGVDTTTPRRSSSRRTFDSSINLNIAIHTQYTVDTATCYRTDYKLGRENQFYQTASHHFISHKRSVNQSVSVFNSKLTSADTDKHWKTLKPKKRKVSPIQLTFQLQKWVNRHTVIAHTISTTTQSIL